MKTLAQKILQEHLCDSACAQACLDVNEHFHIGRAINSLKAIWADSAKTKNTIITTKIDRNLPNILPLDALKLQHCMNNLVENALKYTRNGRILIAVTLLEHARKKYLAISVQDTGLGMETEQVNTLFSPESEPEKQGLPAYGVVDTGLPMIKTLVKEMGGRVLVKSLPAKGSIFSLVLPLSEAMLKQSYAEQRITPAKNNTFKEMNILVVDDYNLNQLTIKTLLHDTVSKVHIASHGYQALEVLHSCRIDIILMDIHMPIMDGIEATMKIRSSGQIWADVKIIAMTADPHYHHTHLCEKIGMDASLAKPVNRTKLLQTFELVMRGERPALAS